MTSITNGAAVVEESTTTVGNAEKSSLVSQGSGSQPARGTASKYDFVKVKVWLGSNADHYYILSRFLISRMLLVTKIPNHVAIKISLELKKLLIDNSLLDVSQSDLEANLFKLMERRGYGAEYIERYKMMTRFHHQRLPLIILVCGTACVGKSTLATQLAQRLNLPNVLQTDMVYELLRTSSDALNSAPLASKPVWSRDFASSEELVTEFCRECRIVRKGLDGDLKKAMKDGKPVIIEGLHLDPSIYLMNEESGGFGSGTLQIKAVPAAANSVAIAGIDKDGATAEAAVTKEEAKSPAKWTPPKCIIVPVVLKMADVDHQTLLEEWIAARAAETGEKLSVAEKEALIKRLQTIQDYLTSFESQGMTVVNLSATTFPQTLDWMHSYLLECIKQGSTAPPTCAGS
ncbi:uncharacterized protein [Physcomitrium patens]|uniref:2-phosphoglycerate kinase n=1 Tax=Physcomitrium patens TaxID=3218 RepID=A0A2K1J3J2_PHYPA|nr:uncharacterized protein LOC112294886 isoform X2 [Physcomitrium patens]PNR36088.1 hypothetical protein PHYPA_021938 [Physcomitrium patens]|eukprot:XP_024401627.1 uncharacterized protein LOC112294886 isoform X2 [Physcomitrella patens]